MKKKILITALSVFMIALIALLGAKPLYFLYRDISFGFGERTEAEKTVKAFAEEHGLSYGEYHADIIELLEHNPEAEEFVLNYPFREKTDVDVSSYARDTVPLFLQWDPMWGYEKYGSSFLAVTGCGPTALAMVGYYLTGDPAMNPLDLSRFAKENGYYAPGYGSSWTLFSQGTAQLGLEATELPLVKKKMVAALEEGAPVVLAMGKGDFTTTGHYIVLTGVEEGGFRLNDPNSPRRSARLWTYEELEPQIRNIWAITLPAPQQ